MAGASETTLVGPSHVLLINSAAGADPPDATCWPLPGGRPSACLLGPPRASQSMESLASGLIELEASSSGSPRRAPSKSPPGVSDTDADHLLASGFQVERDVIVGDEPPAADDR